MRPLVLAMGAWGQRWVEPSLSSRNLDPSRLMRDMRRNLRPAPLPPRRCTDQFLYPELEPAKRNWWLVVEGGEDGGGVDLCLANPGHDRDLLVTASLRSITAVWMGLARLRDEVAKGAMRLDGEPAVARTMESWLGLSGCAGERRRVA